LVWNKGLDSWVPAFGPASALDLTTGVAETAGKSNVMRALKGKGRRGSPRYSSSRWAIGGRHFGDPRIVSEQQ
jgi:hypothetical protein